MDDGKPPLISLFALLVFSFYLAFVETAIASVSKNKVKISAEHGDSRARHALSALEDFDNAITTILICNNIVSVSIATIVTVWVTSKYGVNFVSISTIITTIVIFFACEMLPKSLAKKYSFKATLFCADLLYILMKVFKPASKFLSYIGNKVSERNKEEAETTVTEDELQDIVEDMAQEGAIDEEESELISSAIQFGATQVKNIFTPKEDIIGIDIDLTPEENLAIIKEQTHSRIPVYRHSIDNIIGVLQIRKYMRKYMETSKAPEIRPLMDKVHHTTQNYGIQELLPLMSKHKTNMAVVTDNKGKTIGIVTVEDILEELVGDIWDEKDAAIEKEKAK